MIQKVVDARNGQPFAMNDPLFAVKRGQPAAPHRAGWNDIVKVEGGRSEVLVRFDHPAPRERAYMAHCHLLDHEDTGMMISFTVEA